MESQVYRVLMIVASIVIVMPKITKHKEQLNKKTARYQEFLSWRAFSNRASPYDSRWSFQRLLITSYHAKPNHYRKRSYSQRKMC
ncbi:hypothetical protein ABIA69_000989 [Lysinibacillus parviboronicapiens]|uniref:Uncharacterized protein n=1 Tax=Lysinibacillus parviboronicapiens TaxID=436516 RepID=A0ABV2PFW5_9BACI|nr:hypothetical protein [Lysinibacillus parviboronicapiens]